jgi:gas vesicle protein
MAAPDTAEEDTRKDGTMAAWLATTKLLLPIVTEIVSTAIPAFTARKDQQKAADLVSQQITELQTAVTRNAESVQAIAEQLQRTVSAIEHDAVLLGRKLRRIQVACALSLLFALAAFFATLAVLLR